MGHLVYNDLSLTRQELHLKYVKQYKFLIMLKITFNNDPRTKRFILSLLEKDVNEDGVIVDKNGSPVIDIDGKEITFDDFGVVASGSEIFVKDNIVSLFKYHDKYQNQ